MPNPTTVPQVVIGTPKDTPVAFEITPGEEVAVDALAAPLPPCVAVKKVPPADTVPTVMDWRWYPVVPTGPVTSVPLPAPDTADPELAGMTV
jgi:hypothetical protein